MTPSSNLLMLDDEGTVAIPQRAVNCYCRQTYQNKKLLIVADAIENVEDAVNLFGRSASILLKTSTFSSRISPPCSGKEKSWM